MSNFSITNLYPFCRVKITDFKQINDSEHGTANFTTMTPDLRFTPICHECGTKATGIHSWHQRSLKDLKITDSHNQIIYNYRKINCPNCGIRVEDLGVTNPGGAHVTDRLAHYIYELCKLMSVKEVAEHLNLDWKTIKKIDKEFLKKDYGQTDYSNSGYLAIDEIAVGKHHKYLTVVLDFKTGRVLWIGRDRKTSTLDDFFEKMPKEDRENIKAVSMDMWDPYINSVKKWCPNAAIVFDKFHIISDFGNVIDKVRNSEKRKNDLSQEEQNVIKDSKYLLLKNKENVKEKNIQKLEKLLELNKNISIVYILKEELKLIWQTTDYLEMRERLNDWCQKAIESELKPVIKFAEKLKRRQYGILTYCFHPIHNSKLEGVNNKIKEIKRSAYGYHDVKYYILKVKQAFPGDQL